jgi:hypothetical protein
MHFDAAGEVEASFHWRIDDCGLFESNHSSSILKRKAGLMNLT